MKTLKKTRGYGLESGDYILLSGSSERGVRNFLTIRQQICLLLRKNPLVYYHYDFLREI